MLFVSEICFASKCDASLVVIVDCDTCALANCDSIMPDSPVESIIPIAVNKVVTIGMNFMVNNAKKVDLLKRL